MCTYSDSVPSALTERTTKSPAVAGLERVSASVCAPERSGSSTVIATSSLPSAVSRTTGKT